MWLGYGYGWKRFWWFVELVILFMLVNVLGMCVFNGFWSVGRSEILYFGFGYLGLLLVW